MRIHDLLAADLWRSPERYLGIDPIMARAHCTVRGHVVCDWDAAFCTPTENLGSSAAA